MRSTRWSRRHPRLLPLIALPLLGALVAVLVVVASAQEPPAVEAVSTPALPFDMPTTAELRASPHKVFVNYFTPAPLSVDNRPPSTDYYTRNYLSPDGEGGEHLAYGGLWRDRPLPRDPLPTSAWRLEDLKTEVRQAVSAGIDGFYLDMLQLEGDPDVRVWETTQLMMQAAEEVDPGFEIVLMPDLTSQTMRSKSAATLARYTAQLATSPSAYRLADGRLVVMPSAAESHPVAWWQEFMTVMADQYHLPVALVPIFIADEAAYRDAFAPISFGMSIWGAANPRWNDPTLTYATSPRGRAGAVRALGSLWVQPVRVQGARPKEGLFSEAENTTNLRNMWQLARETKADWVQIPTWNDYSEGTQLAPSQEHGYTFLDINSYFLTWFKTGSAPRVVRDVVYVTHRKQPVGATPQYPEDKLMKLRGGSPARDSVEALTFLTGPGQVTITTGTEQHTCEVPAGLGVCTVPLEAGAVSAAVLRSGVKVASVVSPVVVSDSPYVQDLEYVGATSTRAALPGGATVSASSLASTDSSPSFSGSSSSPSEPSSASSSSSSTSSKDDGEDQDGGDDVSSTITPVFDTYVNQASKGSTYGKKGLLASRGRPGYTSYLEFALPAAPSGRRLVAAKLRLATSGEDYSGSEDTHLVTLSQTDAVSDQTDWAGRPRTSPTVVGSFGAPERGSTVEAALAPEALAARAGTDIVLSVSSRGSDNWWFASSEAQATSRRPQLVLEYR